MKTIILTICLVVATLLVVGGCGSQGYSYETLPNNDWVRGVDGFNYCPFEDAEMNGWEILVQHPEYMKSSEFFKAYASDYDKDGKLDVTLVYKDNYRTYHYPIKNAITENSFPSMSVLTESCGLNRLDDITVRHPQSMSKKNLKDCFNADLNGDRHEDLVCVYKNKTGFRIVGVENLIEEFKERYSKLE